MNPCIFCASPLPPQHPYCLECEKIQARFKPPVGDVVATHWNDRGDKFLEEGDYERAVGAFSRTVDDYRLIGGQSASNLRTAYIGRANAYRALEKDDEAQADEAAARRHAGPEHGGVRLRGVRGVLFHELLQVLDIGGAFVRYWTVSGDETDIELVRDPVSRKLKGIKHSVAPILSPSLAQTLYGVRYNLIGGGRDVTKPVVNSLAMVRDQKEIDPEALDVWQIARFS